MSWVGRASLFAFVILMPSASLAQNPGPVSSQPVAASDQGLLKPADLDALVAPIALYPDTLLAEILMASTYPLEVVQAERWATENKNLKGDALKSAIDKQAWDDSVKALVATPDVLTMMSTKLDWTQKLGDAVLAQQPDIMDAIQRLRSKAHANNKLTSTKEQKVTVKQEQNKQVIVIEPAVPNTIYVPYYNPAVVYGAWPYPTYPPYYFPPPGYIAGGIVATGLAFGAGYAVGRWASGGNYWGGGVNWSGNTINVNRPVNINTINNVGNSWQHNPVHRQGVAYNNANLQQRFGNTNIRAGSQQRIDFRGRGGDQVLKPGGSAPGVGDRGPASVGPGVGTRGPGGINSGLADRGPANRPTAGNRATSVADRGPSERPNAASRLSTQGNRPQRDSAFGNVQSGQLANLQSQRGQASLGGRSGGGGAGVTALSRGGGAAHVGGGLGGGRGVARAGGRRR